MTRFIVRRLLSMIVVLFAISVLTFLIFQAIPNGDPAVRLGGRTATPETREAIRRDWGFDKPIYEQYGITMKKIFTGTVVSYSQQIHVFYEPKRDLPATFSLVISAVGADLLTDTGRTVISRIGVSTPVFLLGALVLGAFSYKLQILLPRCY